MRKYNWNLLILMVFAFSYIIYGNNTELLLLGIIIIVGLMTNLIKNIHITEDLLIKSNKSYISETVNSGMTSLRRNVNQYLMIILTIVIFSLIMILTTLIIGYGISHIIYCTLLAISFFATMLIIKPLIEFALSRNLRYESLSEYSVFCSVHKIIKYLFTVSLGEMIFLLSASIIGWPLLSVSQVLLLKLITDIFPILAFATEYRDYVYDSQIEQFSNKFFELSDWIDIFITGIIIALSSLFVYRMGLSGIRLSTTMAFYDLSFCKLLLAMSVHFVSYKASKIELKNVPSLLLIPASLVFILVALPNTRICELLELVLMSRHNYMQVFFICSISFVSMKLFNKLNTMFFRYVKALRG